MDGNPAIPGAATFANRVSGRNRIHDSHANGTAFSSYVS